MHFVVCRAEKSGVHSCPAGADWDVVESKYQRQGNTGILIISLLHVTVSHSHASENTPSPSPLLTIWLSENFPRLASHNSKSIIYQLFVVFPASNVSLLASLPQPDLCLNFNILTVVFPTSPRGQKEKLKYFPLFLSQL